jgi:hypothetical protein
MQRIDGADQLVVEADQVLSGIGLISNAGARFEAPETISGQGRFEDVPRGGYDPISTWRTCGSTGWRARSCIPRRALLLQGDRHAADVGDLPRLQRLARRVLPAAIRPGSRASRWSTWTTSRTASASSSAPRGWGSPAR